MTFPQTRPSLIVRLRDPQDQDAWTSFVELYRPAIMRVAQCRGLQSADSDDLAQTVLMSVAKAVSRFDPNGTAKFRTWLMRIAINATVNTLQRTKPDQPGGANVDPDQIDVSGPIDPADACLVRLEANRAVFQWATLQVRPEFTQTTWLCFWMTAVDGISADQVAQKLGRSRGSVYASRCRVMKRIVATVQTFASEDKTRANLKVSGQDHV